MAISQGFVFFNTRIGTQLNCVTCVQLFVVCWCICVLLVYLVSSPFGKYINIQSCNKCKFVGVRSQLLYLTFLRFSAILLLWLARTTKKMHLSWFWVAESFQREPFDSRGIKRIDFDEKEQWSVSILSLKMNVNLKVQPWLDQFIPTIACLQKEKSPSKFPWQQVVLHLIGIPGTFWES